MGISIQIAVEHHNMDAPIFLSPEAAEQIVRALRRRERRTMHYAVQLGSSTASRASLLKIWTFSGQFTCA